MTYGVEKLASPMALPAGAEARAKTERVEVYFDRDEQRSEPTRRTIMPVRTIHCGGQIVPIRGLHGCCPEGH